MSDSEYSSDEEDEDYVPGVESGSDEEHIEGEEDEAKSKKRAPNKGAPTKKKRKGGIQLEDEDNSEHVSEDEEDFDAAEAEERARKKKEMEEATKKAKINDLWASFKKDTQSVRPKSTETNTTNTNKDQKSTKPLSSSPASSGLSTKQASQSTSAKKVIITKTYDFAGEAVTVTKTVEADSSEAKKAQSKTEEVASPAAKNPTLSPPINTLVSGTKRKGGLGSLLGQLGKKTKISTLEKSKLDWDTFKAEEGIEEDLKNYNKDGYLEKQDFLQRTDVRLFEREKATRQGMRKR